MPRGTISFPCWHPASSPAVREVTSRDVDGNEFIEYGMGCRAVTLGHAFPPVVKAAREEMLRGTNFSRPAPIELECARNCWG